MTGVSKREFLAQSTYDRGSGSVIVAGLLLCTCALSMVFIPIQEGDGSVSPPQPWSIFSTSGTCSSAASNSERREGSCSFQISAHATGIALTARCPVANRLSTLNSKLAPAFISRSVRRASSTGSGIQLNRNSLQGLEKKEAFSLPLERIISSISLQSAHRRDSWAFLGALFTRVRYMHLYIYIHICISLFLYFCISLCVYL